MEAWLFFQSKIPVYTPNEGVWDWFVIDKVGLQRWGEESLPKEGL